MNTLVDLELYQSAFIYDVRLRIMQIVKPKRINDKLPCLGVPQSQGAVLPALIS